MNRIINFQNLKDFKAVAKFVNISEIQSTEYSKNINLQKRCLSTQDYQYLQNSIVPTLHFQKSLPRLPVPHLEKTCSRYLESLKPLVSEEQFVKTKSIVAEFQEKEGKKLHEELVNIDKYNKHTSYISGFWFDMYLRDRQPIVLNYNPFLGLADDPKSEYNDQLIRATNLLISSLRFMKSLRKGILEPEVFHLNPEKSDTKLFRYSTRILPSAVSWYGAYMFNAYPLDMSQYSSLFNSTRIPQEGKDTLFKDETARHILIIKNGKFYVFDVIDQNGNILSPNHLYTCMKYVHEDQTPPPEHLLGYLTAENRDTWAKARQELLKNGNEQNLRLIDSALFALILDDSTINNDPVKFLRTMLYGDGGNRWFDKSFQLIIAKDKSAVNMEHAWGDGVAVLRFCNEITKDSSKNPYIHPNSEFAKIDPSSLVTQLKFNLNGQIKNYISKATENYVNLTNSLGVDVLQITKCNKEYFKKQKISPDSIMQLTFQMAYYRLTGKTVATYESCSTSAFKHGRTETIRPATMATKECSIAFSKKPLPDDATLKDLIMKCSKLHNQLTKNAAMGQGFDRHLFALRKIAEANNSTPAIFNDPSYSLINHNILSTSTLSSPQIIMGGFGPVVKDGLGVGYVIADHVTGCVATSYPPHQDGKGFIECVNTSIEDICDILTRTKK